MINDDDNRSTRTDKTHDPWPPANSSHWIELMYFVEFEFMVMVTWRNSFLGFGCCFGVKKWIYSPYIYLTVWLLWTVCWVSFLLFNMTIKESYNSVPTPPPLHNHNAVDGVWDRHSIRLQSRRHPRWIYYGFESKKVSGYVVLGRLGIIKRRSSSNNNNKSGCSSIRIMSIWQCAQMEWMAAHISQSKWNWAELGWVLEPNSGDGSGLAKNDALECKYWGTGTQIESNCALLGG